jgi:hypothetical protein
MRESDVVGVKDALECRKNQPIISCQIRERMEQLHNGSPNGVRFTVIRLFSAAWSVFHVPLLPAFLSRCMLDASVERKVSRPFTAGEKQRCAAQIIRNLYRTFVCVENPEYYSLTLAGSLQDG